MNPPYGFLDSIPYLNLGAAACRQVIVVHI